eukprot:RCo012450
MAEASQTPPPAAPTGEDLPPPTTPQSPSPEDAAVATGEAAPAQKEVPKETSSETAPQAAAEEKAPAPEPVQGTKDRDAERALSELTWDYDQSEETLNLHFHLPPDAGKVSARTLGVDVNGDKLKVRLNGKTFVDWTLFSEVEKGEEELELWNITDNPEGGKILNLELGKKEKEMWPYVVSHRLIPDPAYFVSEEDLAAARRAEIEKAKGEPNSGDADEADSSAAPAEDSAEVDEHGIPVKPQTEEFASDEERDLTSEELWERAMKSFSGEDIAEGIRLLRLLAIHRHHVQSCHTLHKVYGDERNWGVPKSNKTALWFLNHASRAPEPSAATFLTLARYYELGNLGLPQSLALTTRSTATSATGGCRRATRLRCGS